MSKVVLHDDTTAVVKKAATRRNTSIAALVNKVLTAVLNDKEVSVVLNVPRDVSKNRTALREWLNARVDYLVENLNKRRQ